MAEPFLGEIRTFGFNFAPQGWAQCNGQLLPIQQNAALFSLLGTQYGGDGVRTFALPNLQGRAPVHVGTSGGVPNISIGQSGGAASTTLSVNQMPSHSHSVACSSVAGNQASPAGNYLAKKTRDFATAGDNNTMAAGMIEHTGGSQPVPTQSPFLGLNFCIALVGIFPSRT
jgi:microcystin-dependent protein